MTTALPSAWWFGSSLVRLLIRQKKVSPSSGSGLVKVHVIVLPSTAGGPPTCGVGMLSMTTGAAELVGFGSPSPTAGCPR